MTLNRFLIVAFLVFSFGIVILFNGLNRAPLRYMEMDPNTPHKMGHSSQLQSDVDILQKRS